MLHHMQSQSPVTRRVCCSVSLWRCATVANTSQEALHKFACGLLFYGVFAVSILSVPQVQIVWVCDKHFEVTMAWPVDDE